MNKTINTYKHFYKKMNCNKTKKQTFELIRGLLVDLTAKPKIPLARHIVNLLLRFHLTNQITH